ncbi:DUF551 domain-containing protein [Escherichia coli]
MTTLTDKELIKEIRERIGSLDVRDNIERRAYEIALASLEAEAPNLPGGFTIEEAKELHENLVKSHVSKALSGEKMKKENRDADLRWIHGVIVQAAWFVKASLEQNALSGNSPVTPGGWISCSERMPEETGDIIVVSDGIVMSGISYSRRDGFYIAALEYDDDEPIDGVTHWMHLPEPPQEVNRG